MKGPIAPLCVLCTHFRPDTQSCVAFSDGIPEEILTGQVDHFEPFADESTLFELADGVEDADVEQWKSEYLELKKQGALDVIGEVEPEAELS